MLALTLAAPLTLALVFALVQAVSSFTGEKKLIRETDHVEQEVLARLCIMMGDQICHKSRANISYIKQTKTLCPPKLPLLLKAAPPPKICLKAPRRRQVQKKRKNNFLITTEDVSH